MSQLQLFSFSADKKTVPEKNEIADQLFFTEIFGQINDFFSEQWFQRLVYKWDNNNRISPKICLAEWTRV